MSRILNPLFNRRVFLAFSLLICAVAFASWFAGRTERSALQAPESVEVDPHARWASSIRPATPYQQGYMNGFDAFLKQTDQYIPRPLVASYTSSEKYEMDNEEVERGYVDGYHRASELQNCPRSGYEH